MLDHGIVGDSANGDLVSLSMRFWYSVAHISFQYVSCPLHKRNFTLTQGECLNDHKYQILTFQAREDPDGNGDIQLLLPPKDDMDAVLGTEKWLIRQAQSEALGLNLATQIDIVGPQVETKLEGAVSCEGSCGNNKLEW